MIKDIIYYNKKLWFKDDEIWTCANEIWDKDTIKSGFGSLLKIERPGTVMSAGNKEGSANNYFSYYTNPALAKPIKEIDKTILFAFKNGYIDKKFVFHPGDVPFTTVQIPMDYNSLMSVTAPNTEVMEYLNWMVGGDANKIKSMTAICGSLLSTINDGLFGILYSKNGGTGKTQLLDVIQRISPTKIMSFNSENTFGKAAHGNKFPLTGTDHKTGLIGQELPTNLNKASSDLIKSLADPGMSTRAIEEKGANLKNTDNNLTLVVSTNRISKWFEVDNALKSRVAVVNVSPNKSSPIYSAERFDEKIRNDNDAMEYLMNLCIANYLEAKKSWRAEGFRFGISDTEDYWNIVEQSDSIMLDFAEEGLFDFIERRESDFISNTEFGHWYSSWNHNNGYNVKVTQLAMKKKTQEYFEKVIGVSVDIGATRKIDGKNQRGILINGFSTLTERGE